MASYTPAQLYGPGTLGENISSSVLFAFSNTSNSSYFVLETVKNPNGFYDSTSPNTTSGSWKVSEPAGFVTSSQTIGFVVPPGYSSLLFTPATSVTGSRYYLRGTGDVTLTMTTPLSLFTSAEKGVWFDASDLSTLFQDKAGTIPVTTVGQFVGKWLDKSGNNNHATASANDATRPTYQIDPEGNPNVTFTKSGTQLITPSIDFTATAQITACVGLNVLDSGSAGIALELGADVNSVNGSFLFGAPSAVADHSVYLRGTSTIRAAVDNVSDGDDIITGLFDISQATKELELIPRLNFTQLTGSQITWTGTTAGTGNFGNLPLYIGSRSGITIPYGGKIYQIIVRGAASTANQIYQIEAWTDAKLD
jgi:hypothetical protein